MTKFYVSTEDSSLTVITLNYVHSAAERQPGDIEVRPCGWTAEGAPGGADSWCRRMSERDFEDCRTPEECQEVVDAACREAGTDSDPAWASFGPMVVFERVNEEE